METLLKHDTFLLYICVKATQNLERVLLRMSGMAYLNVLFKEKKYTLTSYQTQECIR